jgi:hypothetical protein
MPSGLRYRRSGDIAMRGSFARVRDRVVIKTLWRSVREEKPTVEICAGKDCACRVPNADEYCNVQCRETAESAGCDCGHVECAGG